MIARHHHRPGLAFAAHLADTREAFEETGLKLAPEALVDPIWRRRTVFSFDGRTFDAEEWFFHAQVDGLDVGAT